MAITFAPKRGALLMCDFDMACIVPEMRKTRQVAVISIDSLNHRRANAAGTCMVVPFSTGIPQTVGPEEVFIPAGTYRTLPMDSWARCKMVTTVSHDRLDLYLHHGRRMRSEFLSAPHMQAILDGVRYALGG